MTAAVRMMVHHVDGNGRATATMTRTGMLRVARWCPCSLHHCHHLWSRQGRRVRRQKRSTCVDAYISVDTEPADSENVIMRVFQFLQRERKTLQVKRYAKPDHSPQALYAVTLQPYEQLWGPRTFKGMPAELETFQREDPRKFDILSILGQSLRCRPAVTICLSMRGSTALSQSSSGHRGSLVGVDSAVRSVCGACESPTLTAVSICSIRSR